MMTKEQKIDRIEQLVDWICIYHTNLRLSEDDDGTQLYKSWKALRDILKEYLIDDPSIPQISNNVKGVLK